MVYGGLRSARWLRSFRQAPMVTAFRNLESGQVLFSQTLHPQQVYIDQQFKWPNWENKKPVARRDLWRPLAVAQLQTHEHAVQLYNNLVALRHQRDMLDRKQAQAWRRKSDEGNIWFWNQYRPTYTYEAVADLVSAFDALGAEGAVVHWDASYRKGSDNAWDGISVEHRELPRHNPREQHVVLNSVRQEALVRARAFQAAETRRTQTEAAERRALGKPTHADIIKQEASAARDRRNRIHAARLSEKAKLLAARPDLRELQTRGEAVRVAAHALRNAEASFDPFLPHGQRGAAKQPIKLRKKALRQAKRAFRELKKRIAARNNKRRVPQPRIRLNL